ncbi:restriction endonuclease subunit S [Vibrio fluvialis]|uniref:restriction endonuclease subunit S n=1 Tax=Vibrio fluvialis TaxID=676 RepID=UPI001F1C30CA|nr:restriction endonuclease subunit S [Vibrio fluvialis]MCE7597237.1 restriction endonuclease subunit S [Vibrio fluvialis]
MVPNGWCIKRLDQVVSSVRKITYGIVVPGPHISDGNLMIRAQDYSKGWNDAHDIYRVSDSVHESYRRSQVKEHDVLLTIVGSIGNTAIVPKWLEGANLTQQTARLAFEKHDPFYFYSVISSSIGKKEIYRYAKSGVQPSLNLSDVAKFKVPVPPLPEQQKIAKILSTWDKAIATTEKLIATSQQQKKALMQQLLTGKKRLLNPETGMVFEGDWDRHSLSDLVYVDKKSLGKKTPDDFEFKYISLSDVATGNIGANLEIHKYATAPSRARRVLQNGDILLSTVRPNLKGFAKISEKHADCIASTGFSVLTPKKRVSADYIYQYIFSSHVTGQIDSLVVGSNYPAINSSDVAGLKIYCPTYEEQQKIASVLTAADKEIELLQAKLAHFKEEKKALMQQLLTGKRRVKVEHTEAA